MHTTYGPSGRAYHHSSAGSVDDVVHFALVVRAQETTIHITMRDVLHLAAEHIRAVRVDFLEQSTDAQLLGLPETRV